MLIRIAGITEDSIVDGPGLRLTVFVQGCHHGCKGCHNPETHRFDGGQIMNTAEIIAKMDSNPLLDGITLSGGEPFLQREACTELAKAANERGRMYGVIQATHGKSLTRRSNTAVCHSLTTSMCL